MPSRQVFPAATSEAGLQFDPARFAALSFFAGVPAGQIRAAAPFIGRVRRCQQTLHELETLLPLFELRCALCAGDLQAKIDLHDDPETELSRRTSQAVSMEASVNQMSNRQIWDLQSKVVRMKVE